MTTSGVARSSIDRSRPTEDVSAPKPRISEDEQAKKPVQALVPPVAPPRPLEGLRDETKNVAADPNAPAHAAPPPAGVTVAKAVSGEPNAVAAPSSAPSQKNAQVTAKVAPSASGYDPSTDSRFVSDVGRALTDLAQKPEPFGSWASQVLGLSDPARVEQFRAGLQDRGIQGVLPQTRLADFDKPSVQGAYVPDKNMIYVRNQPDTPEGRARAQDAWLEELSHHLQHAASGNVDGALHDRLGDEGEIGARSFVRNAEGRITGIDPDVKADPALRAEDDTGTLMVSSPDGVEKLQAEFSDKPNPTPPNQVLSGQYLVDVNKFLAPSTGGPNRGTTANRIDNQLMANGSGGTLSEQAANVALAIVSGDQMFRDGNHRTASWAMNDLLAANGFSLRPRVARHSPNHETSLLGRAIEQARRIADDGNPSGAVDQLSKFLQKHMFRSDPMTRAQALEALRHALSRPSGGHPNNYPRSPFFDPGPGGAGLGGGGGGGASAGALVSASARRLREVPPSVVKE